MKINKLGKILPLRKIKEYQLLTKLNDQNLDKYQPTTFSESSRKKLINTGEK